MKTSNKLLLGLFTLIVVSMIIGNIVLKSEAKKSIEIENTNGTKSQTDTVSGDSTNIHIHIR
ncbi:MAG: hypothetical protein PHR83_10565 [Paludibacter sp.]|nr:hypothetical protein [Paludibacter sp.]